jgi:hypothetical protein
VPLLDYDTEVKEKFHSMKEKTKPRINAGVLNPKSFDKKRGDTKMKVEALTYKNEYKDGVLVQLTQDDIGYLKLDLLALRFSDNTFMARRLINWIIKETEETKEEDSAKEEHDYKTRQIEVGDTVSYWELSR